MRAQLQQAIREAGSRKAFLISGEHVTLPGEVKSFDIQVHRLPGEAPDLLLLCFVDVQQAEPTGVSHLTDSAGIVRIGELEHELEVTRAELHSAIRNLEISGEQQAAEREPAAGRHRRAEGVALGVADGGGRAAAGKRFPFLHPIFRGG